MDAQVGDLTWSIRSRRPLPGASPVNGEWVVSWSTCAVMGIVNATPDSFSDGGVHADAAVAIAAGRAQAAAGAMVIDVGGESTRPGAQPVGEGEELRRILPVISALAEDSAVLVSVDTRHPRVAAAAVEAGAHLVNDISGLREPAMVAVCASLGVPVVIMHMQGEPSTMQADPRYDDVVGEVAAFLDERAHAALDAGVPSVLVDPGIGFGKTVEHNLALLRAFPYRSVAPPVLVGASRKGMIGSIANVPHAADRDPGSIAVHLDAARRGAAMVRAHDVRGHVQALRVAAALRGRSEG
jgi:dihydropteroate synthase